MFIHFNDHFNKQNHIINLNCVKYIDYTDATMEDLILDNLSAAEIAEKCDNLKINFHFTNETERHFFVEKDFFEAFKKELGVKSVDTQC